MPVRTIGKNYLSASGRFYSLKNGRHCAWQGDFEESLMYLLEIDPDVVSYEEQPVRVPVPGNRPYVPDILIHHRMLSSGKPISAPILGEVKPAKYLREKQKEFRARFQAAREYAQDQGWNFQIFSDKQIKIPRLGNARWLVPFLKLPSNVAVAEDLLSCLQTLSQSTPTDLVLLVQSDPKLQPNVYAEVWKLIASHRIATNLNKPINAGVKIWIPQRSI